MRDRELPLDMSGGPGERVDDDVELTQLGHVKRRGNSPLWSRVEFSFRGSLRDDLDEDYLSLVEGRLAIDEAVPLIARCDNAGTGDVVRYTSAGELRKVGFEVTYEPTETIPGHVAVRWEGSDEWDEAARKALESCFAEYMRGTRGLDD